jgi:translocator protein
MIPSWLVIGTVTFIVAMGASILRPKDIKWFRRLRRPHWLTFEPFIPIVWIVIFICGAWSAYIVWENDPGSDRTWLLMGLYLLVEIAIVLYQPLLLWSHNLIAGTLIGGLGAILGIILTLIVLTVSAWAALLLLPYVIWSPIGTYATWAIDRVNQDSLKFKKR